MPKAFYKHKLLLDEHLPARTLFRRLNQHFDVKHIAMDLHRAGTKDPLVYAFAVSLGRILITRNTRHFASLAGTEEDAGVIGVPPHWQPEQIDSKLTALLMQHGLAHFNGKLQSLSLSPEEEGQEAGWRESRAAPPGQRLRGGSGSRAAVGRREAIAKQPLTLSRSRYPSRLRPKEICPAKRGATELL
jgi:hypothetical protein